MLAFSEGVLLAEKSGIDRKTAVEVLTNSVIASPMVQYRGPFVLEHAGRGLVRRQHDAEGHDATRSRWARQLGVPLPTGAVANEFLTAARGLGLEKKDFAAIFHVLAKLSGVQA